MYYVILICDKLTQRMENRMVKMVPYKRVENFLRVAAYVVHAISFAHKRQLAKHTHNGNIHRK